MSAVATVLTVGGTVAGTVAVFVGGLFADAWRTRLGIKAAKDERDDLRGAAMKDRRDAFELETLLELQETIQKMARNAASVYRMDEADFRATGLRPRADNPLPEHLGGEESMALQQSFSRLQSRIFDDPLRGMLEEWSKGLAELALGRGLRDVPDDPAATWMQNLFVKTLGLGKPIHDRIGARIRELYAV